MYNSMLEIENIQNINVKYVNQNTHIAKMNHWIKLDFKLTDSRCVIILVPVNF